MFKIGISKRSSLLLLSLIGTKCFIEQVPGGDLSGAEKIRQNKEKISHLEGSYLTVTLARKAQTREYKLRRNEPIYKVVNTRRSTVLSLPFQ